MRLLLLLLGCLIASASGLLVPVNGPIHLYTNLPKISAPLSAIKTLFSSAAVDVIEVPRDRKLCDFILNDAEILDDALVVIVGETDHFCDVRGSPAVIQLSLTGESAQFQFRNDYGTLVTSGRFRAEFSTISAFIKATFFDLLSDRYLLGGDVNLSGLIVQRKSFWRYFTLAAIPSWFFVLLGIGLTLFVQNKLIGAIPKVSETELAQQKLQLIRADDTAFSKHTIYSGINNVPFTADQFRYWMKLATEFAIDYFEHPEVYNVTTSGTPGFIYKNLPKHAPEDPEPFESVLRDMYKIIMPGLTHWQHPRFHAYFATGLSYPDIIAETLISSLGTVNFCWDSSPAFAELEVSMVNWVGRCFGLPESFLFNDKEKNAETSLGGGAMQDSASDAVLVSLLAARHKRITEICGKVSLACRDKEHQSLKTLVAYASTEAHSCIEKAALIALVHLRPVKPDEKFSMRGEELERQIKKDLEMKNTPFFVHVTLGTTGVAAYDNLKEVVEVAKKYNLWVHVDAAYGGNAWVCPEFRYQMEGIEHADVVSVNLHKMFLHTTAATFMWTRHQRIIKESMDVNPVYLRARHENATDFRHWSISLSRRARCLKTWFILRTYGIKGMQEYIRRTTSLCAHFRKHLEKDPRVEIVGEAVFSLVCFKIKGTNFEESNRLTKAFCEYINNSQKMVVTHATCNGIDVVRFSLGAHQRSLHKEVDESYQILSDLLEEFLNKSRYEVPSHVRFAIGSGIVGSPALSTQSTLRSTSSLASMSSRMQSPARSPARSRIPASIGSVSSFINVTRDPENLKDYPEPKSEKTPSNDRSEGSSKRQLIDKHLWKK